MTSFIIVDDDIGIRKVIRKIIEKHELGFVIAECEEGAQAEQLIYEHQPDIVLIDLLLPVRNGIQIINTVRPKCADTAFIMISQANSEKLVAQAYQSGIEFFIHKPINVLEIVFIVQKVLDNRNMRHVMSQICKTTAQYSNSSSGSGNKDYENVQKTKIFKMFSELGILGEKGTQDIYKMVQIVDGYIHKEETDYQLSQVFQQISHQLNIDTRTVEQRVRRTVAKALENIANFGIEDYYNERFQTYNSSLFDFKEVRMEMDFINGKGKYHGKVNVKKFIEGLNFLVSE
jgi:two-component system response regulator YcbB